MANAPCGQDDQLRSARVHKQRLADVSANFGGGLHTLPRPYKDHFAMGTDDRTYHKISEMASATLTSARGGASSVTAWVHDASPRVPLHLAYGDIFSLHAIQGLH